MTKLNLSLSLRGLGSAVKAPFCSHLMTVIAHAAPLCHGSTNLYCFLVSYLPAFVSRIFVANTLTMFTKRIKLTWNERIDRKHSLFMESEYSGLCGLCARWWPRFFFLFHWKFPHQFNYSFINFCVQKGFGILQTEHWEPCQTWNSSIIFITVIWQLPKKIRSSCRIGRRPCAACRCLFHLCCAAGSHSLTGVFATARPLTLDNTQTQTVPPSFCHYIWTSISHCNWNYK